MLFAGLSANVQDWMHRSACRGRPRAPQATAADFGGINIQTLRYFCDFVRSGSGLIDVAYQGGKQCPVNQHRLLIIQDARFRQSWRARLCHACTSVVVSSVNSSDCATAHCWFVVCSLFVLLQRGWLRQQRRRTRTRFDWRLTYPSPEQRSTETSSGSSRNILVMAFTRGSGLALIPASLTHAECATM